MTPALANHATGVEEPRHHLSITIAGIKNPGHTAPPEYSKVLEHARAALGFPHEWKPIIIGLDGLNGAGKSSLACWLAWQLNTALIHLDMFTVRDSEPQDWRTDDLKRAIDARLNIGLPVIVEGMLLLDALQKIGCSPGFLVFVTKVGNNGSYTLRKRIDEYFARQKPHAKADHEVIWAEGDARA